MADANPSLKSDRYNVDTNPNKDKSPIRKADGTNIIKVSCPICGAKYGYNSLDGDPGCQDCEAREAARLIKQQKLDALEAEAERIEKENAEFAEKEAALKARIDKAQKGKGKK
jgi:hypothetical protein